MDDLVAVSVHTNTLVIQKAYDLLLTSLGSTDWCPSLKQFRTIFVNYGASPERFNVQASDVSSLRLLTSSSQTSHDVTPRQSQHGHGYNVENLVYVVKTLGEVMRCRFTQFSANDVLELIHMVALASLDSRLVSHVVLHPLHICLSVLLNAIEERDFCEASKRICIRLAAVTQHHHNKVYVVSIMPPVPRGVYVSRMMALVFLKQLLKAGDGDADDVISADSIPETLKVSVPTPQAD